MALRRQSSESEEQSDDRWVCATSSEPPAWVLIARRRVSDPMSEHSDVDAALSGIDKHIRRVDRPK
jgi:hypothetical protein